MKKKTSNKSCLSLN